MVPVHDARPTLPALVDALAGQSAPGGFEVLFVDDGSSDGSAEWLAGRCEGRPGWRVLRQPQQGPAAARNRGLAESTGNVVAFTDSDCAPDPGWVEAIAAAFAPDPALVGLEGPTYTSPPARSPFDHFQDLPEGGFWATCNVAYRRAPLVDLGGFDPRFPYGHEDTELAIRARRLGPLRFEPAMRVNHPPVRRAFGRVVRTWRHWIDDVVLYECQPDAFRSGLGGHSLLYAIFVERGVLGAFRDLRKKARFLRTAPGAFLAYAAAIAVSRVRLLLAAPHIVARTREAVRHSSGSRS